MGYMKYTLISTFACYFIYQVELQMGIPTPILLLMIGGLAFYVLFRKNLPKRMEDRKINHSYGN
jgi:ABC-type xylose transport system permease subunit